MNKHKKLLRICKFVILLIILVSIFAIVLLYGLKYFSDYRPNTIELMIICMLVSLAIRAIFEHYYKKQNEYKTDVKNLNSVYNDMNKLVEHVSRDVQNTNNNHS